LPNLNENELFQAALGLLPPWMVDHCSFSVEPGRLDIFLDFPRGSCFACPLCAAPCKAYDTDTLTWRHLNFFQHQTYLHTPRRVFSVRHPPRQRPLGQTQQRLHLAV